MGWKLVKRAPPLRGDIWIVELEPAIGRELPKTRPCAVVSPDHLNAIFDTLTVVPLRSGNRLAPFRVPLNFRDVDGLLLTEQIRTVDFHRFRQKVGTLENGTLIQVLAVLRNMFKE